MNKVRRIAAIIGIIILVGIYIATLVVAIAGKEDMTGWLLACFAATVLVPSMIWVIQFLYKRLNADMEEADRKYIQQTDQNEDNTK